MQVFGFAVESEQDVRQTWGAADLEWAQNGARIRSSLYGAALVFAVLLDGTDVLIEGWSHGGRAFQGAAPMNPDGTLTVRVAA